MFEGNVLERDELALAEIESPQSVPASREPSVNRPDVSARAPSPHQSPAARQPAPPARPEQAQPQASDKAPRKGLLHRRPVVSAIGAVLLASAIAGGYLYI